MSLFNFVSKKDPSKERMHIWYLNGYGYDYLKVVMQTTMFLNYFLVASEWAQTLLFTSKHV